MKKILALILAVMMVACVFAACGAKADTADTTAADTKADETTVTEAVKTVKDGKLIMATNASFPPYEYVGDDGEYAGIDVEVAGLIAEKLGLELEIADIEFDSIIPGVQGGKYDMGMAGMTVTDERKLSVNFSDTYAKGVQVIIVAEGSSITSVDDLTDDGSVKIGVQQGTTGCIYAEGDYGTDNVVQYANGALAVEALKSGKVNCVIIDNEPAKAYVAANDGLVILDTTYVEEDYAICFSKDATALQEAVNNALVELIADGSVQKVVDKYITAD